MNAALTEMEAEAGAFVDRGAPDAPRTTRLIAQMRYAGQGWEIPVTLDQRRFTAADLPDLTRRFEAAYRTLFGRIIEGLAIEVTNWLLTVSTVLPPATPATRHGTGQPIASCRTRQFFDAGLRQTVIAEEIPRHEMSPGTLVDGPAVIVEDDTTTIVTSAYRVVGQGDGSLRLMRKT